jgi:hypothetical protein
LKDVRGGKGLYLIYLAYEAPDTKDRSMDRQQKINKVNTRDGRVSKVSNLEVQPTFIHPNYRSEPCDGILSETGKLEVLKVVPKSGDGPYFIARWDEGSEHLDIDMHGASNSAIRKFKRNKDGFAGHHTSRTTEPDKRLFEVKIEAPAGVIFDGTVSFSNTYQVIVALKTESTMTIDAQVIRAGSKPAV